MPVKGSIQNGAAKITYDFSGLAKFKEKYPDKVSRAIRETAFDAEGEMKLRAAVDTGAMRASVYVATEKEDNYGQASSDAHAQNPKAETSQHPPPGKFAANVGPCVEYAIYQEFGTSKMGAHPFVVPGAYEAVKRMPERFKRIFI